MEKAAELTLRLLLASSVIGTATVVAPALRMTLCETTVSVSGVDCARATAGNSPIVPATTNANVSRAAIKRRTGA
jgi:hypothetical protein